MKCNAVNVVLGIFIVALFVLAGCGGGGSATSSNNSFITSVGWVYEDAAPDYVNNSSTCFLSVIVYYNESITAADIDSFGATAPNGWQWTISASNSQLSTSSSGRPYIGSRIYYGTNPYMMPLAGTWVFQLKLKNGQISSVQKSFHEPGSAADATHQYVYAAEDWTPSSDTSQYIAALGRFPEQGYTLQYSAANGGLITTTGLATVRTRFLAAQPHAYNMVCWLYDVNKAYLGYTITEFSPQDHSRTNLIDANGELSIVPASTASPSGQVDLSAVKYLRFVYFDGAQYEPSSYSNMDYRSISPLVAALTSITVSPSNAGILKGSSQQFTASGTYTDGNVRDVTTSVTWSTSDANLAVISNSAGTKGQATALNDGAVTITEGR
jgi:Big-like domain-containing protein